MNEKCHHCKDTKKVYETVRILARMLHSGDATPRDIAICLFLVTEPKSIQRAYQHD